MAWFRSRKTPGGEQQMDYLNATDTAVRPLALPSLLIALLLVCAIAFLLFVIGRWGYQEISKSDAPTISEVATTDPNAPTENSDAANGSSDGTSDANTNQGTGSTNTQSGSTDSSTSNTSGSGTGGTGNTGTDTSASTSTSANTSSTDNTNSSTAPSESIPNTGPSSLVGVFAVTVVLSSIGYYAVKIRSLQRS